MSPKINNAPYVKQSPSVNSRAIEQKIESEEGETTEDYSSLK